VKFGRWRAWFEILFSLVPNSRRGRDCCQREQPNKSFHATAQAALDWNWCCRSSWFIIEAGCAGGVAFALRGCRSRVLSLSGVAIGRRVNSSVRLLSWDKYSSATQQVLSESRRWNINFAAKIVRRTVSVLGVSGSEILVLQRRLFEKRPQF
jgi:hypothetical protein